MSQAQFHLPTTYKALRRLLSILDIMAAGLQAKIDDGVCITVMRCEATVNARTISEATALALHNDLLATNKLLANHSIGNTQTWWEPTEVVDNMRQMLATFRQKRYHVGRDNTTLQERLSIRRSEQGLHLSF